MNYITAKETRVIRAWNKRGLAGLRAELLQAVESRVFDDLENYVVVTTIARTVYGALPEREWEKAHDLIRETCGLIDIDSNDWSTEIMQARQMEETLREEVGDE